MILVCCMCRREQSSSDIGHTTNELSEVSTISTSKSDTISSGMDSSEWTQIHATPEMKLDIRYAQTNNFVQRAVYPCAACYLKKDVAVALIAAAQDLQELGYGLIIYDCYRPHSVQKQLWEIVPDPTFVANPEEGSMHNRGLAVDLGLTDREGQELDMGSSFDHFGPESRHTYTVLSDEVKARRSVLKQTMNIHGFEEIASEWWHYSYRSIQAAISDDKWTCH